MFHSDNKASTTATTNAVFRACFSLTGLAGLRSPRTLSSLGSIKLELLLPSPVIDKTVLALFVLHEHVVFHDQAVHLSAHKTGVGFVRSADYRLTANVERGINYHRTLRQSLECCDRIVVDRVVFASYCLYASRVINVRNSGNCRTDHV